MTLHLGAEIVNYGKHFCYFPSGNNHQGTFHFFHFRSIHGVNRVMGCGSLMVIKAK